MYVAVGNFSWYGGGSFGNTRATFVISNSSYYQPFVIEGVNSSVIIENNVFGDSYGTTSRIVSGKQLILINVNGGGSVTFSQSGGNIKLQGGIDYTMQVGDTISFIYNGTNWIETARTSNKVNVLKSLGVQTVGTSQATIAHGLGYMPSVVTITMTSPGNIYKSASSDSTNIYLTADSAGRTAEIFVR